MDIIQTLLITVVVFGLMVGGYYLWANSGVASAQKRRLQSLRYRHSDSTDAKVESQFKKAIAARKPKAYKIAGSGSQLDA